MSNRSFQSRRRALLGMAILCAAKGAHAIEAVPGALARPALPIRHPAQAFLLDVARAGKRLVAVGERGLILHSDDLGQSWKQVSVPVSATLTTVCFSDADNGVAVGHGGVVLTTRDAGRQWTLRLDGRRAAAIALAAAQALGRPEAIQEAQRLVDEGPDKPFLDVLMPAPDHLIVIGAYGLALESLDGGSSWRSWTDRFDNPGALHYYAMRRSGDTMLIAGEQGMVQLSRNGGGRFRPLQTPYPGSFFTAEILAESDFLVAGLRGNAWRSRDGGQTWVQLQAPSTASITASTLLPDGLPVLCNQMGMLMAMQNDSLAALECPPLPGACAVRALEDRKVIVLSRQGPLVVGPVAL